MLSEMLLPLNRDWNFILTWVSVATVYETWLNAEDSTSWYLIGLSDVTQDSTATYAAQCRSPDRACLGMTTQRRLDILQEGLSSLGG